MSWSASALAAHAMRVAKPKLDGALWRTSCSLCGTAIEPGDPAGGFDDYGGFAHLVASHQSATCQACASILANSDFLTTYSRAVFTPAGGFRMTQATDIAWMLLHAEPPFLAVFNTRKSAHVICHGPVTLDRRAIGIVMGSVVGTIRPTRVLEAREALARLTDRANAALSGRYIWAVEGLSIRDDSMCEMLPSHDDWLRKCADVADDLERFDGLNLVERWALSALLLAAPDRDHPLQFSAPPDLRQTKLISIQVQKKIRRNA